MATRDSDSTAETPPVFSYTRKDVWTLANGSVRLHWPSRIRPDEIEELKTWMALQAERMERAANETGDE